MTYPSSFSSDMCFYANATCPCKVLWRPHCLCCLALPTESIYNTEQSLPQVSCEIYGLLMGHKRGPIAETSDKL